MDYFSLHPSSGSQTIYAAVSIMRAYHEENGEGEQRSPSLMNHFEFRLNRFGG